MRTVIIRSMLTANDLELVSGGSEELGSDTLDFDGRYDDGRYDDGSYDDGSYDDGSYDDGYEPEGHTFERDDQPDYESLHNAHVDAVAHDAGHATTFYESGPVYTVAGAQRNYDAALAAQQQAAEAHAQLSAEDGLFNHAYRYFSGAPTSLDGRIAEARTFLERTQRDAAEAEGHLARAVNREAAGTGFTPAYQLAIAERAEPLFDTTPLVEHRRELAGTAAVQLTAPGAKASFEVSTDKGFDAQLVPNVTVLQVPGLKLDIERKGTDAGAIYALTGTVGPYGVKVDSNGSVSGSFKPSVDLGVAIAGVGASVKLGIR